MASPIPYQRPQMLELLTHPSKTVRFIATLYRDSHVSLVSKLLFVIPLLLLFAALLVPDTLFEGVVSAVLPVVGPIMGIPADAALDWVTIGVVGFGLLHVFPAVILDEHYRRIFHRKPLAISPISPSR